MSPLETKIGIGTSLWGGKGRGGRRREWFTQEVAHIGEEVEGVGVGDPGRGQHEQQPQQDRPRPHPPSVLPPPQQKQQQLLLIPRPPHPPLVSPLSPPSLSPFASHGRHDSTFSMNRCETHELFHIQTKNFPYRFPATLLSYPRYYS